MDFGEDTELTVLKQNLQMPPTNANDEYLKVLLKQAASLMTREGIATTNFEKFRSHSRFRTNSDGFQSVPLLYIH